MKGCLNLFIGIALLIFVINWLSEYWVYVVVFAAIAIGVYLISKLISKPNSMREVELPENDNASLPILKKSPVFYKPIVTERQDFYSPPVNTVKPLLDNSTSIYLSDILGQIQTLFQDVPTEPVEQPDTSFTITTSEQRILTDLKSIGDLLGLEIEEDSTERNILLAAFSYFLLTREQYSDLIDERQRLNFLVTYYQSFHALQGEDSDRTVVGLPELANKEYFVKLKEIITLITTIDFVLTGKEKEVLDIFNSLTKDNFKRNIPITKPFRF